MRHLRRYRRRAFGRDVADWPTRLSFTRWGSWQWTRWRKDLTTWKRYRRQQWREKP